MNNNNFNVNNYGILNDSSNMLIGSTNSTETNLKNIQSNVDKLFSEDVFSGAGLKNISENYQIADASNSENIAGL